MREDTYWRMIDTTGADLSVGIRSDDLPIIRHLFWPERLRPGDSTDDTQPWHGVVVSTEPSDVRIELEEAPPFIWEGDIPKTGDNVIITRNELGRLIARPR